MFKRYEGFSEWQNWAYALNVCMVIVATALLTIDLVTKLVLGFTLGISTFPMYGLGTVGWSLIIFSLALRVFVLHPFGDVPYLSEEFKKKGRLARIRWFIAWMGSIAGATCMLIFGFEFWTIMLSSIPHLLYSFFIWQSRIVPIKGSDGSSGPSASLFSRRRVRKSRDDRSDRSSNIVEASTS
jgi:hypothetical protein